MGKFDRRSRDQKRKAKLKREAERSRKHESLAYHGKKYRTAEFVPILHRTEVGIYETFVMTDRTLTDDTVEKALGRLILQMREGPLPPLDQTEEATLTDENAGDLVTWNIRRNWRYYAEQQPLPKREDLIGVLRTILHSLEIWRSQSLHSQGYLRHLEGFMKQTGVSVDLVSSDLEPLPGPEEDPLLELGRDWTEDGDPESEAEFAEEVEALLRSGQAERMIEVCQQLLGETENRAVIPRLEALALRGHQAQRAEMG